MAGRLCPFPACCSARVLSPCQCLSEPSPGHQLFPESRDWALATQLAPKGWVCFCVLHYVSAAWWGILLQRQQVEFPAEPRSPGTSWFKQWKHSVKNSHFPVPYVFFWWVDKSWCPPPPPPPLWEGSYCCTAVCQQPAHLRGWGTVSRGSSGLCSASPGDGCLASHPGVRGFRTQPEPKWVVFQTTPGARGFAFNPYSKW